MSFTELFAPGMRHWREQRELQKVLVNETPQPDNPPSGSPAEPAPTSTSTLTDFAAYIVDAPRK